MNKVIEFNEEIFSRLTDESLTDIEKWEETVLISKECGSVENNPKLRVILELIYHALQFSLDSGLKYPTTAILMDAIQNELYCMLQNIESDISEDGCKMRYLDIVSIYIY
jgi:hypothetical protein